MIKKLMALCLCFIVVSANVCVANDTQPNDIYNKDSYTLSLAEAIELATKDNPQFLTYDTKISDYKYQLERSRVEMRNSKGPVKIPEGLQVIAIQKGYNVKQNEINFTAAQMEKEQAKNKLAYNVTEKYYNVKLSEALVKSSEDTYNLTRENEGHIKLQYELGMVSELDYKNACLAVIQAKANLDKYSRNLEIATEDFRIALQIQNPNAVFTLTDSIEKEEFSANLDEDTKKALESRLDVFKLKKTYEQSILYREAMQVAGKSSTYYSSANSNVIQCEYAYENNKKLIALSIKSTYNNVFNAEDALSVAEAKAELKEQEYTVAKLKYDLGLITNGELTNAMLNLSSANVELDNSKLTYKLAVQKYLYEITLGL